ncbi:MAG: helix-turn-helix domain-containing protein [Pseudomonadota bacterium]
MAPSSSPVAATSFAADPQSILTKQQVCDFLQMSPRALEMAVRRNEFPPAVRVGKRVYWSRKSVENFIREQFREQDAWRGGF